MQFLVLHLTTATLFLAAAAVMLRTVMAPLFRTHLGERILDAPRCAPAATFHPF